MKKYNIINRFISNVGFKLNQRKFLYFIENIKCTSRKLSFSIFTKQNKKKMKRTYPLDICLTVDYLEKETLTYNSDKNYIRELVTLKKKTFVFPILDKL